MLDKVNPDPVAVPRGAYGRYGKLHKRQDFQPRILLIIGGTEGLISGPIGRTLHNRRRLWVIYGRSTTLSSTAAISSYSCRDCRDGEDARHGILHSPFVAGVLV